MGIILSGGPASVYDNSAPKCDPAIFDLDLPILGICYGMQLACEALGGHVGSTPSREYGRKHCYVATANCLFDGVPQKTQVWMSHGDQVSDISEAFTSLATTGHMPLRRG